MNAGMALTAALVGYLLGSISFARIIVRWRTGGDVELVDLKTPDGHAGISSTAVSPTAVRLQLGAAWGLTAAAGDILKAFVPTLAFRLLFPGEPYLYICALFAIIGHNWPIFHRFVGGRGQSPMIGGMLAIAPVGAIVCLVAGSVIGFYVVRDAMVADNLGQVLFIGWTVAAGLWPGGVVWALAANVVFFGSYLGEIRQYVAARRGGHLPTTDDAMRMMRMDYEWMGYKKSAQDASDDEEGSTLPTEPVAEDASAK